jgi:imidazolonepropionase-like amidohydrolase
VKSRILLHCLSLGCIALGAIAAAQDTIVINAASVHVGDGEVFRPGAVVLQGGKILAVGQSVTVPEGAKVIDATDGSLTPGLIDAACQLGTYSNVGFGEGESEVIPHLEVLDAVDLHSDDFEELVREGVTAVYVTPEAASVIGGQGVVVKTGGAVGERVLPSFPSVKANLGPETYRRADRNRTPFGNPNIFTRRPTTRMGSVWVFRKAFYDALNYREYGEAEMDENALKVLVSVLEGDVRLRMQARQAHDIYTARRLTDEFGLSFVLEYGLEAYRCLDLLAEQQIPVIFGPVDRNYRGLTGRAGDSGEPCLEAAARLRERGITFALTAADGTGEAGLARQAGMAIRFGLDPGEALKAVTSVPAELLGLGQQVGSLEAGMDADLVLWSGDPLVDDSAIGMVIIGGEIVHGGS